MYKNYNCMIYLARYKPFPFDRTEHHIVRASFRLSPFLKHLRKVTFERRLCWYWCEKARKHVCVIDRHNMTSAVKVAFNPSTTNQPSNQPSNQPTKQPTNQPTNQASNQPTNQANCVRNSTHPYVEGVLIQPSELFIQS